MILNYVYGRTLDDIDFDSTKQTFISRWIYQDQIYLAVFLRQYL